MYFCLYNLKFNNNNNNNERVFSSGTSQTVKKEELGSFEEHTR